MKYCCFIPFVNRRDFLDKAIASIRHKGEKNILLIDNSDNRDLGIMYRDITVFTPCVPLSFTQSMNLIQQVAYKRELDFFVVMHSDTFATKKSVDALFTKTREVTRLHQSWGVIFTLYDCLASYNTQAVKVIGAWDTAFVQYFADNDYYRRMRLKGYETVEAGNTGITHMASATIKNDLNRYLANQTLYMSYRQLYISKWGGVPNNETYQKPYNRLSV